MITIPLKISNKDYSIFNLNNIKEINFSDLEDLITLVYAKKSLKKANEIAEKEGLSTMTMEEINAEIKASRFAKSNN